MPVPDEREHGEVIKLGSTSGKGHDGVVEEMNYGVRIGCVCFVEKGNCTIETELLLAAVGCFRQAVCIDKENSTGRERKTLFPITNPFHGSDRHSVPVFEDVKLPVGIFQHRIFMPGIGSSEFSGPEIEDAEPDGDKHVLFVSHADHIID